MPCIQGSTHLPCLLSLSFKEFESTSKLPNFPSAVSCFNGAMASLAVRRVLNVSLNSTIILPFLRNLKSPSQRIKASASCIQDILEKEDFPFLRFQRQYTST